jgi:hypothetical protein
MGFPLSDICIHFSDKNQGHIAPALGDGRSTALPPRRPRDGFAAPDPHNRIDESAFQHRPPGNKRELAALFDHSELATRKLDGPPVHAFDFPAGLDIAQPTVPRDGFTGMG